MSVKKQLLLNGLATVVQKAVIAARQLLVVPFFLSTWGLEQYGEWITLSAIPTAMSLWNLGLGTAAGNRFVLCHGAGDTAGAARAMRAGMWLVTLVVVAGGVLGGLGLWLAGMFGWLGRFAIPASTSAGVIILLGLTVLVGFYSSLNEAWFRAARRNHEATHFTSLSNLVATGLTILLLLARQGMVCVAAAQLVVAVASVVWLHRRGTRLLPEVRVGAVRIDRGELKGFFAKGFAFMMNPLRQAINAQGVLLVTRAALGPEAVVLLATLRTVGNSLAQAYLGINTTIFPELQHAIASSRLQDARRIYRFGIGLTAATALAGCTALAIGGPWLYEVWTHAKLDPPRYAWSLLLGSLFISSLWWTAGSVFRAVNQPERVAWVGIATACAGVGIAGLLVGPLGINGALVGNLCMELMMASYVLPATCKILAQPLRQLPGDIFALRREILNTLRRRKRAAAPAR